MRGAAVVGTLLLVACAGARDQELVVYASVGGDEADAVEENFEAAHPEVNVRMVPLDGDAVLARLRSQSDEGADVWWGGSAVTLALAASEGLLATVEPAWDEPGMGGGDDPEGRWFAVAATPYVFAFNRDETARSRMPRDWLDLFHPRWFQEVIVPDPAQHGATAVLMSAWIAAEEERTGDLEAGFDWLTRLDRALLGYAEGVEEALRWLRAGTGSVAVLPRDAVEEAMEERPWLGYTLPESGSPLWVEGAAVLAGAPSPALARDFIAFVGPARPPSDVPVMATDYGALAAGMTPWMERWLLEIKGRGSPLP